MCPHLQINCQESMFPAMHMRIVWFKRLRESGHMARKARTGERAAQHEQGVLVRDTIAIHFMRMHRDHDYLNTLARDHPSSYVSLVTKTVPAQARIEVAVEHTVDLGQAMLEASQRLALAQEQLNMIDITPATPATPATSDLSPDTSDVVRDTSDV